MPNKKKCNKCKGKGYYNALISMHDDKKERMTCDKCKGKGYYYEMTDDEENDYWENYW
tara:strand:+ start:13 stop:186 length:174 start_codon:yes stop_codon:yes gene_type:complete